jgi:hypothetical protein
MLQLMLLGIEGDEWVFKRDRSIRGPLKDTGRRTPSGVTYLAPEVQLLTKARPQPREKDDADFRVALPLMNTQAFVWLLRCLKKRVPEEHEWIETLQDRIA